MAIHNVCYVFDCPLHGHETSVLCFRAFEEKNKHLWQKYEMTSKQVDISRDELEEMLAALHLAVEKGWKTANDRFVE